MEQAIAITVQARRELVPRQVVELRLAARGQTPLPPWEPGAHVDLVLASGLTRQYSLCGALDDDCYTVAVLREPESRGGSVEVHDVVKAGDTLMIRGPRNHFRMVPTSHAVLVAGGIGITPLIPMIKQLAQNATPWELHYGGRSRDSLAYVDSLTEIPGGTVSIYPQDEVGHIPLEAILDGAPSSSIIYTCGPEPLLTAVEKHGANAGLEVHLERFGPSAGVPQDTANDAPFEVTLLRSARTLPVPAGTRLIDVVRDVVPMVPFSCEEGYCGSCETAVLEGVPDHRDSVLSDAERESNTCMMICVGRSKSPQLVLDL